MKKPAQRNFKKPAFGSNAQSFKKTSSFSKSTRKPSSFGTRNSEFSEPSERDAARPRRFDRDSRQSFGQDRHSFGQDRPSFDRNYRDSSNLQSRRPARGGSFESYEHPRFSEEESAWLGEVRDFDAAPRKKFRDKPASTFVRSGAPRGNKERTGFATRKNARNDVATSFKDIETPAMAARPNAKKKSNEKNGELLFGAHSIIEALKAKRRKLISVYTTQPTPRSWERIQPYLPKSVPNIQYVSTNILSSMAEGGKHMGIVAWFSPFPYRSKMFDPATHPLIVILDGVQDVQNLGAILRSAHCVGFNGVVLNTTHAAPLTGGAHKASAGLAEHMDIHLASSTRNAMIEAKKAGYNLYLAVVNGGENAMNVEYTGPACLVIGSEETGISADLRNEGTKISLPQKTEDMSFNASVAAGILMFVMQQKLK